MRKQVSYQKLKAFQKFIQNFNFFQIDFAPQAKISNPLEDEKNKLQNAQAPEYFPFGRYDKKIKKDPTEKQLFNFKFRPGAGAPVQRGKFNQNSMPSMNNDNMQYANNGPIRNQPVSNGPQRVGNNNNNFSMLMVKLQ